MKLFLQWVGKGWTWIDFADWRQLFWLWPQCTASAVATFHAQVWSFIHPWRLWARLCSGCVWLLLSCPALPNPMHRTLWWEMFRIYSLLCFISSASPYYELIFCSCRICPEIQDVKYLGGLLLEEVGTFGGLGKFGRWARRHSLPPLVRVFHRVARDWWRINSYSNILCLS